MYNLSMSYFRFYAATHRSRYSEHGIGKYFDRRLGTKSRRRLFLSCHKDSAGWRDRDYTTNNLRDEDFGLSASFT